MSFSDPATRAKAQATREAKQINKEESSEGDPMAAVLAAMQEQIARLTRERDEAVNQAAQAPAAVLTKTPDDAKEDEEPDYLVTVLHGYGVHPSTFKHWVDDTEFVGGVAKNVPWSVAKHWVKGTRPGGGRLHGRVKVQVLPNDATPYDYAKAVGVPPMEPEKLAAVLDATNLDLLCQTLGPKKARLLADSILARTSGKI